MLRRDHLGMGITLGFIAPLIGMLLYYFTKFYPISLSDFFYVLGRQKTLISGIVSVSLIANAVLFTIYINTRRDLTAKGIFTSTCVYAVGALILKFFL
ncbi:chromosome condensin MukBEF MukE localization factor [Filimonas zeae]|uniref:Uncharacterized protein n=1 Tax=Filimonas zeae TaxID=1737353 RepID=A0A917MS99_9BACT|nr:hypothetical protein [Filimonas zeae]MDR6337250.1 chromosome condensin MukBEF MukE localization factor [Filimonas zeae]GGH57709.1 hypothetical protein GCM10011379_02660 [Filimonas zeae]